MMFQDAAGAYLHSAAGAGPVRAREPCTDLRFYDTYLGHGIVGGSMVTFEEIGRKAAQLGLRILAGEDPQTATHSVVAPARSDV